jgi:hypothetical protein
MLASMRRVTVEQIREALSACDGRVARAARVLGIARNNLYKRLASSGISPDEYRDNTAARARVSDDAHATRGADFNGGETQTDASAPAPVFRAAIFPRGRRTPTLAHVNTAAPDSSEPKQLRLSRSVYLRPDQIKALDDACLDLPRVLREKLSPSKVLERFIDDCFGEWIGSKLGEEKPARRTRTEK